MLGYGAAVPKTEGVQKPLPGKRKYRVVIDCGTWDPKTILARLCNGGCPNRHCVWRHVPPSNTVHTEIETTTAGLEDLKDWLRHTYVLPKGLVPKINPIR